MDAGIVQIIVAIIGAASPIIIELIQEKTPSSGKVEVLSTSGQSTDFATNRSHSLLDLSIILLGAAFFSTIIADSLLVSGRAPTLSILVLVQVFLIALLTSLTLVLAWYWHRGELVLGVLSVTTLVVLILSPGGPLNPSVNDGEVGLSLLLPVSVLIIIATSSAIYSFANPLDQNTQSKLRNRVSLFILLLLSIGSLALGQQFISGVLNNPRTPKFDGNEYQISQAEVVLSKLRKKNLQERGYFYRLGSEIALSKYYRDEYFQVLSSFDFTNIDQLVNSDSSDLFPDARTGSEISSEESISSDTKNYQTAKSASSNRIRLLKAVAKFFSSDHQRQLSYLADRILWIHPTVTNGNKQLNLSLPGKTTKERFEFLDNYRIYRAMSSQRNLLDKFFKLFEYDSEIVEAFSYKSKDNHRVYIPLEERYPFSKNRYKGVEEETWSALFPSLPAQAYTSLLNQQLAFPEPDELFVAYSSYGNLAPSFTNKQIQNSKDRFDGLKPETQAAFITYIADERVNFDRYDSLAKLAIQTRRTNEKIPSLGGSISATIELANLIDPEMNTKSSSLVSNTENINNLANLINQIFKNNPDGKTEIAKLLRSEQPQVPIKNLFTQKLFDFVISIQNNLTVKQKELFFSLLRDPVTPTILQMSKKLPPYKDLNWLEEQLNNFIKLTPKNKEAILHHLAITTYRATGKYSLNPVSLLIFQAGSLSGWLAFLCATILMLPIVSGAIVLGAWFGSKLVERDRTRDLIFAERSNRRDLSHVHALGIPVELQGRQNFLAKLRKLSGRGWSTIGVVGRRGVGKSRVLYEIYQPTSKVSQNYGIRVWMSAPSQYQEEDFIESTLEQLALNAEQAVADYLGAEPLAVRKLEALLVRLGLVVFVVASCILAFMLWIIYQRLLRPEVMITWFPILLVFIASAGCLIKHLAHLQPVDLSPWLESDRVHSPHTVLLYRRIQRAFKYLRYRTDQTVVGFGSIPEVGGENIKSVLLSVIATCLIFTIIVIISENSTVAMWLFITTIVLICIISLKFIGGGRSIKRGKGLMSLISEYRNLCTSIVYRLENGALGNRGTSVMICIDELDKIIELEQIRSFIRRMKGIFEVPGVYYYLSLSEDALSALYLGSVEGKNEVDSSLDHIVRIPPLSWQEGEQVARAYLRRRGVQQLEQKIVDALVVLSFGVPRDLLRRCDEFLAKADVTEVSPEELVYGIRKDQVGIAAEAYGWSRQQCEKMLGEAALSLRYVKEVTEQISQSETFNLRESRALVLIWILCCVEFAGGLEENKRQGFLKNLCDMGYRIPISPISDLVSEMDKLDADFLAQLIAS
ncbi:MAG: hypothetical protein F6K56_07590 [Moorea sp. SIO3G5]|nr:hypothetical protein [Moorena sp. SIO3G5]